MFTIKAYCPQGSVSIYEAIQIKIAENRRFVEFIRPTSPELTECLLVTKDDNGKDFSVIYIENQTGKTIESIR